ncbi:hypothetical protein [Pseudoalteromonas phage PH357]|nr:hypothetical protein [Pseudoalteromonas phage PH357]
MSVLACDRLGCENIMCDNISRERQEYLCNECKEELIAKGPCSLNQFMNSPKNLTHTSEYWRDFVNKEYVNRYEDNDL